MFRMINKILFIVINLTLICVLLKYLKGRITKRVNGNLKIDLKVSDNNPSLLHLSDYRTFVPLILSQVG